MPDLKTHCRVSEQRTGFNFEELHRWIDEPSTELGVDHRIIRHAYTQDDEEYIRNYWNKKMGYGWGEKAVIEWLFHIAIDNIHTAFKKSQSFYDKKTYNLITIILNSSGELFVSFGRAKENNIREIFFADNF